MTWQALLFIVGLLLVIVSSAARWFEEVRYIILSHTQEEQEISESDLEKARLVTTAGIALGAVALGVGLWFGAI